MGIVIELNKKSQISRTDDRIIILLFLDATETSLYD